ncbi:Flp family type IVb pilin [Agrobacterium sp. ES01]|uniref:Flp family type IVb pilin n=1 Tax=Agrobacterium sp. ES01 TaxID=3420714 RepID=UPI003D11C863
MLKNFAQACSGATSIEYAIIASLIAVAIISGVTALAGSVNNTFTKVSDTVVENSGN